MKLIIVEGSDEVNFISALLSTMGINDISIENSEGRDSFRTKIIAFLQSPKYADNLTHLAIVGDAETDSNASFTKIKDILVSIGVSTPSTKNTFVSKENMKTGIYIMPGDADSGMLEDLCLKLAKDKERLKLADQLIETALKMDNPPENVAKAKAAAYLSTMPIHVKSVGIAAKKDIGIFM